MIADLERELDDLSEELDDLLAYGPGNEVRASRKAADLLVAKVIEGIFWLIEWEADQQ